ncbi:MAG: hypothetical protein JO111_05615 [Caulobacteraceae bacterium]|nr:hypothetical protein [Caulobacteraceae bacterium]
MFVTLAGGRIKEAKRFFIEGPGVMVSREPSGEQGRVELVVSIAVYAPLGWRYLEASLDGETHRLARAFEVVGPFSYSGGGRGIGSHLI